MSLLDRVKAVPRSQRGTDDKDSDVAIAYLKGEISLKQINAILNHQANSATYVWIVLSIRKAFNEGKLVVNGQFREIESSKAPE